MARRSAPVYVGAITLSNMRYDDVAKVTFNGLTVEAVATDENMFRVPAMRSVVVSDSQGLAIGSFDAAESDPVTFDFLTATAMEGGVLYTLTEPDENGDAEWLFVGHACDYTAEGEYDIGEAESDDEASEETPARGRGRGRGNTDNESKETIRYDDIPDDEPSDEELGLPKKPAGRPSLEKVEARRELRAEALARYNAKRAGAKAPSRGRTEPAEDEAPRGRRGIAKAPAQRSGFRR